MSNPEAEKQARFEALKHELGISKVEIQEEFQEKVEKILEHMAYGDFDKAKELLVTVKDEALQAHYKVQEAKSSDQDAYFDPAGGVQLSYNLGRLLHKVETQLNSMES